MEKYKQTKKVESVIVSCMLFFVVTLVVAIASFVRTDNVTRFL